MTRYDLIIVIHVKDVSTRVVEPGPSTYVRPQFDSASRKNVQLPSFPYHRIRIRVRLIAASALTGSDSGTRKEKTGAIFGKLLKPVVEVISEVETNKRRRWIIEIACPQKGQ